MEYADHKRRCVWVNPKNELYIKYHDEEWGQPVHDDRRLFEMLILESFQAGLSWECVLNKRSVRPSTDLIWRRSVLTMRLRWKHLSRTPASYVTAVR